jgi:hypothetical protein
LKAAIALICIHPDPRRVTRQVRVQVKSRYATDCDRGFPLRQRGIDAFDFLVIAFLDIGKQLTDAGTFERDTQAR